MHKYKYEYVVCTSNSPKMFKYACAMIENSLSELMKESLLIDVDGSTIQIYHIKNEKIAVYDDYDIGTVFILSDVNLDRLFSVRIN